jgi:Ca2+/Na+ antiporter
MLNWNASKVKNLTGAEIWLFIVSRVLIAFGAGVLFAQYFPRIAEQLGLPAVVIGLLLFVFAAKGMFRRQNPS